ncbi:hypothetical protein EXIGLDRAFT_724604 [Exidia glandulosa HHB12029]|uniref:F-box domain-containing protein n=1 Tax=Exidia glandulosa HHB12029 TaxID=1314781 RepID=A0A165MPQ7_EXIGL|nr:hypothetical protein EXIGLDRAFT_724604 [Exidia glandulosa HHB12029]
MPSMLRTLRRALNVQGPSKHLQDSGHNEGSSVTPWSLPPELLCSIFLLLDYEDRLVASHVCKYWRDVSFSYPAALWSTITTCGLVKGAVRAHLERARDAPELSVRVYSQTLRTLVECIHELSSHMPRVRHLAIVVAHAGRPRNVITAALAHHDASNAMVEDALRGLAAPALHSLILAGRNLDDISILGEFLGGAPNLRALNVSGSFRLTPEACRNVTGVETLVISVHKGRLWATAECIPALPQLRHLHVTILREPGTTDLIVSQTPLSSFAPSLQSLYVVGNSYVPAFARRFSLRAVRSLRLDYQAGILEDIVRSDTTMSGYVNVSLVDSKSRDGASIFISSFPTRSAAMPHEIFESAREVTLSESWLLTYQDVPHLGTVEILTLVLGSNYSEPRPLMQSHAFETAPPTLFSVEPMRPVFDCPSLATLILEARPEILTRYPMLGRVLGRPFCKTRFAPEPVSPL